MLSRRGVLKREERAGESRIAPNCGHYGAPDRCGGCQWQHVALDVQREAKRQIVRDSFQRIAKREIALPAIHAGGPFPANLDALADEE